MTGLTRLLLHDFFFDRRGKNPQENQRAAKDDRNGDKQLEPKPNDVRHARRERQRKWHLDGYLSALGIPSLGCSHVLFTLTSMRFGSSRHCFLDDAVSNEAGFAS